MSAQADDSPVGRQLGRYTVRGVLGSGLFGTVYRAWDPEYDAERALKALHQVSPHDNAMHERLWHDVLAAAQVRHPNIVPVYDVFDADGVLCVVSELVPSRSLADLLQSERLPLQESVRIAGEIAAGLDEALRHGVAHRDLKPANVLLREDDGAALVTDFGLAWTASDATLVPSGPVAESMAYWAPELLDEGQAADWRADVYSLAAVVYEMVTGRPPASAQVLGQPPPPARSLNPALPGRVGEVLARGLAREPQQRPEWPGTLARDLAAAMVEERTVLTQPPAPPVAPSARPVPAAPVWTAPAPAAPAPAVEPRPAPPRYAPPAPMTPPPAQPPPRARRRRRSRGLILAASVVIAVLVLGGAGLAAAHYVAPMADARPAGVSDGQIFTAVAQRFQQCSTDSLTGLSTLVTCPQQGDRYDENTEGWRLHGDPTLGAAIRYDGKNQFTVNGHFIMVMNGADKSFFPYVDTAPYDATVQWNGIRLQVPRIARALQAPPVPRPAAASDQRAVQDAQTNWNMECAGGLATHLVTAPPCPGGLLQPCGVSTSQEKYTVDQNDTPGIKWDSATGILHLTGKFAQQQTLTSTTPGCPPKQTATGAGDYDLWMVWDGSLDFDVVQGVYRYDQ